MKRFTFILGVCLTFFVFSCTPAPNQKEKTATQTMEKELRHVVLFKFKDGVSADTLKAMELAFKGLATEIKEVKHLECGLNNSPENLNQGFTHCFLVTFASENDRAAYLPHPAHKAFVANHLSTTLDKVCVVDYWSDVVK
jgi:Stress responsive A/B Barrel Domain